MNNHTSASRLWRHMVETVYPSPDDCTLTESRVGVTAEFVGYSGTLTDPSDCWAGDARPKKASLGYGFAELLWYLSGQKSIEMVLPFAPSYAKFADEFKETDAAYGWRMSGAFYNGITALRLVAKMLCEKPLDRRAVVALWQPRDLMTATYDDGSVKDLPCTLSLQFLLRDNHLSLIVTMRSNDIWLGGIYDMFVFCQIQMVVAAYIGAKLGKYVHNVGSLHLYERNFRSASEAKVYASAGGSNYLPMPSFDDACSLLEDVGPLEETAVQRADRLPQTLWAAAVRGSLADSLLRHTTK